MTQNDAKPDENKTKDGPPPVYRLADLLDEFTIDVTEKHKARLEGRRLGPSTGHARLDAHLGQYLVRGVHLIQGAPGGGKTAFALQMAGRCGFPALYVSVEMPLIELLRRTIARETKTYLGKLKTGELGAKESVRLAMEAAGKCPDLAFVDGVRECITPDQIITLAVAMREAAEADHVLIVIDSAQAWVRQRIGKNDRDEYNETNQVIGDLCEIADTVRCPVVTINHKNREGNKGNASQAHSSKGSGQWEYAVESGIDLGPDENTMKGADGERLVWANIWKNRNGEPNVKQALRFHGGFMSFQESEPGSHSVPVEKQTTRSNGQASRFGSGARRSAPKAAAQASATKSTDEMDEYYDSLGEYQ